MTRFCCDMMKSNIENECPDHSDRFDCPDCLLCYNPKSEGYGLIIHDGGTSSIGISYCPWCGTKLGENSTAFEVTGHFFMEERGGFVIGKILEGVFEIGMSIPLENKNKSLTISGIEFLDNTTNKDYKQALIFKEKPSLEFIEKSFPVDTIIRTIKIK